jgi:hypothetical protein
MVWQPLSRKNKRRRVPTAGQARHNIPPSRGILNFLRPIPSPAAKNLFGAVPGLSDQEIAIYPPSLQDDLTSHNKIPGKERKKCVAAAGSLAAGCGRT